MARKVARALPGRAFRRFGHITKPATYYGTCGAPHVPYQNGKQEVFWGQIEGRLLPMLEGVPDLSLRQLNEATLAWVEMEYNRKIHSELGTSPLQSYLHGKDVGRPCPESERLQQAFTKQLQRLQRRSDGTIRLEGQRFEIPGRYHHWTGRPSPCAWPPGT